MRCGGISHRWMAGFRRVGAIAGLLAGVGSAIAGPLADGSTAYQRRDYATAMRLWRPLAEQGNAQAQYGLGFLYANGLGTPQDYGEAAAWFRKAAEQGNALAQGSLGLLYAKGQGVPRDDAESYKWLALGAAGFEPWYAVDPWAARLARLLLSWKMTAAQLADAAQRTRDWSPTK